MIWNAQLVPYKKEPQLASGGTLGDRSENLKACMASARPDHCWRFPIRIFYHFRIAVFAEPTPITTNCFGGRRW
jgi:hypothetical protein